MCTVRGIDHAVFFNCGKFADKFSDKGPKVLMDHALKSLEGATESYMVEVIAESHF